jgi:hypothetical protein
MHVVAPRLISIIAAQMNRYGCGYFAACLTIEASPGRVSILGGHHPGISAGRGDIPGVAVDTEQSGKSDDRARFFFELASGAHLPRFAGLEMATWDRPRRIVATSDKQDMTLPVTSSAWIDADTC